jgi:hypothetical protein
MALGHRSAQIHSSADRIPVSPAKLGIVVYKIAIPRLIEKPIMAARIASRCSAWTASLTERSSKAARISLSLTCNTSILGAFDVGKQCLAASGLSMINCCASSQPGGPTLLARIAIANLEIQERNSTDSRWNIFTAIKMAAPPYRQVERKIRAMEFQW